MATHPIISYIQSNPKHTKIAFCLELRLTTGRVLRYTNHNKPLTVLGDIFLPNPCKLSTIKKTTNLTPENSTAELIAITGSVEEFAAKGRLFENGEYTVYHVNWDDPSLGAYVLTSGIIKQSPYDNKGKVTLTLKGELERLRDAELLKYSATCRAKFGDEKCGLCTSPLKPFIQGKKYLVGDQVAFGSYSPIVSANSWTLGTPSLGSVTSGSATLTGFIEGTLGTVWKSYPIPSVSASSIIFKTTGTVTTLDNNPMWRLELSLFNSDGLQLIANRTPWKKQKELVETYDVTVLNHPDAVKASVKVITRSNDGILHVTISSGSLEHFTDSGVVYTADAITGGQTSVSPSIIPTNVTNNSFTSGITGWEVTGSATAANTFGGVAGDMVTFPSGGSISQEIQIPLNTAYIYTQLSGVLLPSASNANYTIEGTFKDSSQVTVGVISGQVTFPVAGAESSNDLLLNNVPALAVSVTLKITADTGSSLTNVALSAVPSSTQPTSASVSTSAIANTAPTTAGNISWILSSKYYYYDTVVSASVYDISATVFNQAGMTPELITGGLVTFTTGNLAGFSVSVVSYNPITNSAVFVRPLPEIPEVGQDFIFSIGCDKTVETCLTRKNTINFRGEPFFKKTIDLSEIFKGDS